MLLFRQKATSQKYNKAEIKFNAMKETNDSAIFDAATITRGFHSTADVPLIKTVALPSA